MRRDTGFILVNALVLVAALSAVAVYLLSRAETTRHGLTAAQEASALALGLDAVEALALTRLDADLGGLTDHTGESWATPQSGLPLAVGNASIRLADAQGRFNLNWLALPENEAAAEAFRHLVRSLGLSPRTAEDVIAFLRPGGPEDRSAYAALIPPIDPVGGPVLMAAQIADIPALQGEVYARLAPHVTALPARTPLNVNTASAEVLAALFPGVSQASLSRALPRRMFDPYQTVADFLAALGSDLQSDGLGGTEAALVGGDGLDVKSSWFVLEAQVDLNGRRAQRTALIQRRGPRDGSRIAWRLTSAP